LSARLMQVEFLRAELQRLAAAGEGDDGHSQHARIELARGVHVAHGQNEMIDSVDLHQRSSFRTTSLSPDHVSSTAQTLTSTNPSGSATSRIASSVTSVGTLAAFFGQEIHTIARGSSLLRPAP